MEIRKILWDETGWTELRTVPHNMLKKGEAKWSRARRGYNIYLQKKQDERITSFCGKAKAPAGKTGALFVFSADTDRQASAVHPQFFSWFSVLLDRRMV